jgi:hypothetical protein
MKKLKQKGETKTMKLNKELVKELKRFYQLEELKHFSVAKQILDLCETLEEAWAETEEVKLKLNKAVEIIRENTINFDHYNYRKSMDFLKEMMQ